MQKNIQFTKEDFDILKDLLARDDLDGVNDESEFGYINIGAVNCELIFKPCYGDENDPYTYGFCNSVLDCNFYLLGKDDGYAETGNGIPYSYEDGFYVEIKDTYEETLDKLLANIDEHINSNVDLLKGSESTNMTWDNLAVA